MVFRQIFNENWNEIAALRFDLAFVNVFGTYHNLFCLLTKSIMKMEPSCIVPETNKIIIIKLHHFRNVFSWTVESYLPAQFTDSNVTIHERKRQGENISMKIKTICMLHENQYFYRCFCSCAITYSIFLCLWACFLRRTFYGPNWLVGS